MKQLSEQLRPVLNCRDLGGIKTENGRTIRSGLLFRSGGLHLFQEEELDVLRKCGIRTILDLRASYAWKKKPDPDIGIGKLTIPDKAHGKSFLLLRRTYAENSLETD